MFGGVGNDTYFVGARNDIVTEAANQGIDTVITTRALTPLAANVENMVLIGGVAVTGIGNNLNNVITGNSRDNFLYGLDGNDRLLGAAGHDFLISGRGNDVINGGAGDDNIFGQAGRDVMTGGTGRDTFAFSAGDSPPPGLSAGDLVTDFSRAQGDKIDLSSIDANTDVDGNQSFTFGGNDATPATGVVSFRPAGAGQTLVQANTDADAAIEIQFLVRGTAPNLAGDYIL
jgi:Ca2+-binding RTX toxin-like protein